MPRTNKSVVNAFKEKSAQLDHERKGDVGRSKKKGLSIYENEELANKDARTAAIDNALAKTRYSPQDTGVYNYAPEIRAIATLLVQIEAYDSSHGFDKNNVCYAQNMANGFVEELQNFLDATIGYKMSSPEYANRLQVFNLTCTNVIRQNLKGVSRESTFWNFIAPLVNGFLKLIGVEPYKLHTTRFAKDSLINEGFNFIRSAGIAEEDISKIQAENEYDEEDRPSP